jgi:hypothetical protein
MRSASGLALKSRLYTTISALTKASRRACTVGVLLASAVLVDVDVQTSCLNRRKAVTRNSEWTLTTGKRSLNVQRTTFGRRDESKGVRSGYEEAVP